MRRILMSVAVLAVSAMVVGDVLAQRRGDDDRRGRERGKRGEGRRGAPGGGPRGFGGPGAPRRQPPKPGQILPDFLQRYLRLTADQKKKLGELQKDIDAKLGKILTNAQRKQLKEMSERAGRFGRRGFGGRGGPGGRGGFRPRGGPGGEGGRGGPGGGAKAMIKRIMSFDKNKDGKLSKDELPGPLLRIFERADTNKDKVLDQAELKKMFESRVRGGRGGAGGRGGRPGEGGRGGAGGRRKRPGGEGERRRPRRPETQD